MMSGRPTAPEHGNGPNIGPDVEHDGALRSTGEGFVEAPHVNFAEEIERRVMLAVMPYLTVPELEWRHRAKTLEMMA
jgi:hypothetical protein